MGYLINPLFREPSPWFIPVLKFIDMEVIQIKRVLTVVFLLLTLFVSSVFAQAQDTINMTDQEKKYLTSRGPIKIVVDPDWYPYEKIDKNNEYIGIASDLIDLIAQRTGLKFEIVPTAEWKESLEKAKSGDVDAVSFLNKTEERSQWLLFTEPYFVDPNVLITRESHDYISNLSRYNHETMVLPEGTSIEERLRKDYPSLKF
jgi:ABC-type amino acid transport substrate-binding protein